MLRDLGLTPVSVSCLPSLSLLMVFFRRQVALHVSTMQVDDGSVRLLRQFFCFHCAFMVVRSTWARLAKSTHQEDFWRGRYQDERYAEAHLFTEMEMSCQVGAMFADTISGLLTRQAMFVAQWEGLVSVFKKNAHMWPVDFSERKRLRRVRVSNVVFTSSSMSPLMWHKESKPCIDECVFRSGVAWRSRFHRVGIGFRIASWHRVCWLHEKHVVHDGVFIKKL